MWFCREIIDCSAKHMHLKSWHILQPITNLSFVWIVLFFENFIPSKILSSNIISCNFNFNAKAILRSWEFYRSHPFAGNRQSVHIVSFPAGHTRSHRCAGHTMIIHVPCISPFFCIMTICMLLVYPPFFLLHVQVFVMCTASFCLIVTDLKNYCSYCTKIFQHAPKLNYDQ